jgi:putative ABC transport system permease protein
MHFALFTRMHQHTLLRKHVLYFFRKIRMQKEYAALLIFSLSLGIACFTFVFLWVRYERSYDSFHDKRDRIFLVLTEQERNEKTAYSSLSFGPGMAKNFKEIKEFCRIRFKNASLIGTRFHEQNFYLADSTLFRIFTFPFVRGDPETALAELDSIVITEETAVRYFGDKNPLGKTLHIRQFNEEFKITGVVQNIPKHSHIRFDLVARIEWIEKATSEKENKACFTYLLLHPEASSQEIDRDPESGRLLRLQPLARVHRDGWDEDRSVKQIYFYLVIVLIIWALAGINFIILNTVRFAKNAKEVGIRKIGGASRSQIIFQYITESILFSCIAFFPALFLVQMILSLFNNFSGKELSLVSGNWGLFLVELIAIIPTAGFLIGCYPSIILSAIRPNQVLKGKPNLGKRGFRFKKILITLQFSVAIGLILCSFIVFKQLRLIKEKGLGFNQDSIAIVPNQIPYEEFKEKLIEDPYVTNITAASSRPVQVRDEVFIRLAGQPETTSFSSAYSMVDFDFFETFEMEILQGRGFLQTHPWDRDRTCLINESAVQKLGLTSPLGKKIYFDHPAFAEDFKELMIIGIVKDYHSHSMHQAIGPFVFRFHRPWHYLVFVKIKPGYIQQTLSLIELAFKEFNPRDPFHFEFLEDSFNDLYRGEVLMGWLFNAFGLSAVLISCIGLFGLASYSTEYKTKEIGIRKIFGASVTGLVFRLTRELMSCVFLANIIAWPIVYFIMKKWLENYAWRVPLGSGLLLLSCLFTLFLVLLTSSSKIIKIAEADPIDSLRYE